MTMSSTGTSSSSSPLTPGSRRWLIQSPHRLERQARSRLRFFLERLRASGGAAGFELVVRADGFVVAGGEGRYAILS